MSEPHIQLVEWLRTANEVYKQPLSYWNFTRNLKEASYRFPWCSVSIIFQFPHLKQVSFSYFRFQGISTWIYLDGFLWFISIFFPEMNSQLSHCSKLESFSPQSSAGSWPLSSQKSGSWSPKRAAELESHLIPLNAIWWIFLNSISTSHVKSISSSSSIGFFIKIIQNQPANYGGTSMTGQAGCACDRGQCQCHFIPRWNRCAEGGIRLGRRCRMPMDAHGSWAIGGYGSWFCHIYIYIRILYSIV